MKARLIPLFFDPGKNDDFDQQLGVLKLLLSEWIEFLDPLPLGAELPEADAVIFPQLLGEAYRCVDKFFDVDLPRLVITSQFGTLSMWDWEIMCYLESEGIDTIAPYNLAQAKAVCNALIAKRKLAESKFVVYQDNPGEGFQADIFKRFYWWEDECSQRIEEKFGLTIEKRSFEQLGRQAKEISDDEARRAWETWQAPCGRCSESAILSAMKMYLAIDRDIRDDPAVEGLGINCLNESHFSDTTPCLAWNTFFRQREMIWGCEADTVAMLTHYILYKSLRVPTMMTNLYPFLLGDTATKHERIPGFPEIDEAPEDHLLVAHCGYMGVIPQPMATDWTLEEKVLAIVDPNATAINARFPEGEVTLAKLHPSFDALSVVEGNLTHYVQFENSDCRNGGVIRVADGHETIQSLVSHHYLISTGRQLPTIRLIAKVFDLFVEEG